jgi:protein-L-isoaspartate(D-aspartate) O-methyltransferase
MVASQVLAGGVTESRLLDALRDIAREQFVPGAKRSIAYADAPLEMAPGRWLLTPAIFAKLLQAADVQPGDKVLDVGCGTGYSTAVLARLARQVIGTEQDAELVRIASDRLTGVRNATVVQGAVSDGHSAMGPYDVIVVEGGLEVEPERLLAQLAEEGRLVAIRRRGAEGQGVIYLRQQGKTGRRMLFDATAPVLAGFRQPVGFVF